MKRLASTGETAEPCGVPRSRSTTVPSGSCIGAFSQRLTYNTTHFWSVLASTALAIRSWSTESKNFCTSRSRTHAFFQHRSRHFSTAISGDRPGRYPSESSWKIDSIRGSSCRATTVCAILSATVGTPRIRVPPPCGFGISTALTGGGKYVPEDIRFQILYRLFLRSDSKSSMDCPSTPAAPLFFLTLLYASHTSRFGISNDLPSGPDLPTRLLPEHRLVARANKPQMSRPLHSTPVTGTSPLLRAGPPASAAMVLST